MIDKKLAAGSKAVQEYLKTLDMDAIGVASLDDWKGMMEETALRLLPEAHSVVVFAKEVYQEILGHNRPGRTMGEASLNDLLERNADFLNGQLTKAAYDVAKVCHKNNLKALPLPAAGCPMDARFITAVFSFKHAAQAAGLGFLGRNSLLITPAFGPRVRLSVCLTEAVLKPGKIIKSAACETCNACIKICPAGALSKPKGKEPYAINKFACSSFRITGGGCSECVRVCPEGK